MRSPSSNHSATDSRSPLGVEPPPSTPECMTMTLLSRRCDHCSHSRHTTTFTVTTEPDCLVSSVMVFDWNDVMKLLFKWTRYTWHVQGLCQKNLYKAYNATSDSAYAIHNGHHIAWLGCKMTIVTIQPPVLVTWRCMLRKSRC